MEQIIQIRLKISNSYLIKGPKTILVDTGSPGDTKNLIMGMRKVGIDVQDLSLIIHTHVHFDHCGCTWDLKQMNDLPIVVHNIEADAQREGINSAIIPTHWFTRLTMPLMKDSFQGVVSDLTIEDEMDLNAYGVDGRIICTPGHTPGSISVITNNGDAIVGDLMGGGDFMGLFFRLRPRYHYFASNMDLVRSSIKKVINYSPKNIYVGHGGPLKFDSVAKRFSKEVGL